MRISRVLFFTLAAAGALGTPSASASSVEPTISYEAYPDCKSLGYEEIKYYPVYQGTTVKDGVTVKVYGSEFEWTSEYGIDVVIVKGGPTANVYTYPAPGEYKGDTKLYGPIKPGYDPPPLSYISFCYDPELYIKKTAKTSLYRTWQWYIKKSADWAALYLMPTQSQLVKYLIEVSAVYTDSKWEVSGEITIKNPSKKSAKITSVTDVVSDGIYMTVYCPGTQLPDYPYTLEPYAELVCTYKGYLPDGQYRTNTATVESEYVGGGTATAPVDFKYAYVTKVDECAYVTDTYDQATGLPANVCAGDLPKKFYYDRYVGPYGYDYCGKDINVYNKAEFKTNTTNTTGYSTWNIPVYLKCVEGCTLTQGYWKNHSEKGPAPYDETWKYLPKGAYTMFYLSYKTWHEVFKTAPAGNPYYQLAHQYMAAKLNVLGGASSTAAVDAAMAEAEAYFAKYKPADYIDKYLKAKLLEWAKTLDQYNNGYYGPGHCSEK